MAAALWIPAFAGMTGALTGMTGALTRMTGALTGMTDANRNGGAAIVPS